MEDITNEALSNRNTIVEKLEAILEVVDSDPLRELLDYVKSLDTSGVYCAYCTNLFEERDIRLHILECPDHPLARVSRELEAAISHAKFLLQERAELRGTVRGLETAFEKLGEHYTFVPVEKYASLQKELFFFAFREHVRSKCFSTFETCTKITCKKNRELLDLPYPTVEE